MDIRKLHNSAKKMLIDRHVRRGDTVLDCGCGRGGDWHKWKHVGAVVTGVDPDATSLLEASSRAMSINLEVLVTVGDVRDVINGPFDVVCYNFALHYIFESHALTLASAEAIARAVKPGGKLIGIAPEAARIIAYLGPETSFREDSLGNTVEMLDHATLAVRVADGPFYADGPKAEPIMYKQSLVDVLAPFFELREWEPMLPAPTGHISDIYARFIFVRL
jgi:SAM-dependent methyltransferase